MFLFHAQDPRNEFILNGLYCSLIPDRSSMLQTQGSSKIDGSSSYHSRIINLERNISC